MYAYIYINNVCTHTCVYIYIYACVCVYVFLCIYICVCVCVCICVCVCVCLCVCILIYLSIYLSYVSIFIIFANKIYLLDEIISKFISSISIYLLGLYVWCNSFWCVNCYYFQCIKHLNLLLVHYFEVCLLVLACVKRIFRSKKKLSKFI